MIFIIQVIALLACLPDLSDSLIITSVLAGDKKFKTISFDHKWLKPLTFEKDMPNTEFRRHRTMRPPKFDIDVNIPIKLPLEEEYQQEEYKKPVESNIYFQSGEIYEGKSKYPEQNKHNTNSYSDQYASASNVQQGQVAPAHQDSGINLNMADGFKGLLPALAKSIKIRPQFINGNNQPIETAPTHSNARSDQQEMLQPAPVATNFNQIQKFNQLNVPMVAQDSLVYPQARNYEPPPQSKGYGNYGNNYEQQDPPFVPGGFVNLQLSGPTGGPKMTYEDYDKERWAQQLSQTAGAMPYPILNYHQLQNFYGGLGTFTNGLAEHRYVETGIMDKLKSSLNHLTSKFHFG